MGKSFGTEMPINNDFRGRPKKRTQGKHIFANTEYIKARNVIAKPISANQNALFQIRLPPLWIHVNAIISKT